MPLVLYLRKEDKIMKKLLICLLAVFAFNAYAMDPAVAAMFKARSQSGEAWNSPIYRESSDDSWNVEIDGKKLKCTKDRYMNEIKCN